MHLYYNKNISCSCLLTNVDDDDDDVDKMILLTLEPAGPGRPASPGTPYNNKEVINK